MGAETRVSTKGYRWDIRLPLVGDKVATLESGHIKFAWRLNNSAYYIYVDVAVN